MRRKEERSKQGQTNKKAKQHSTPKAVPFPKKNELPRVGLKPTTLYTPDRAHMYNNIIFICVQAIFLVCVQEQRERREEGGGENQREKEGERG